jgi:putative redox protein
LLHLHEGHIRRRQNRQARGDRLRFDFTGLGASEGDFAHTNFTSNVEDLVKAADFLRDSYAAPRILIGHSLGGGAVLAAAHRVPEAVAVATIGAPADPAHVVHLLKDKQAEIESKGEAEVIWPDSHSASEVISR